MSEVLLPRVFIDTEVFFALGEEYSDFVQKHTKQFFRNALKQQFLSVVSSQATELLEATQTLSASRCWKRLKPTTEVVSVAEPEQQLMQRYLSSQLFPSSEKSIALELASATLAKVDYFVCWDFEYVLNVGCKKRYQSFNALQGIKGVELCNPAECHFSPLE